MLSFLSAANFISSIFKLGYLPKAEEYYELTPEQYESYFQAEGVTDEKLFMLLPDDTRRYNELATRDVYVLTESEIQGMEHAGNVIEKYCQDSKKTFDSYEDKLYYAASRMPDVFSAGTKYDVNKHSENSLNLVSG